MGNFYQENAAYNGFMPGTAIVQASGSIGGARHVFVKYQSAAKNGLIMLPIGGILANPFKGVAKAYAGDLCEYIPATASAGTTIKLLKTYKVVSSANSGKTVNIVRDGFKHIPFVGDILMVSGATLEAKGTGSTVTAVKATTVSSTDVWELTLSTALTTVKDDVLVEADKEGADAVAVVQNPNSYLPCDYNFVFSPNTSGTDINGAQYHIDACLANDDTKIIIDKASPLPKAVLALNKSRINGWFNL